MAFKHNVRSGVGVETSIGRRLRGPTSPPLGEGMPFRSVTHLAREVLVTEVPLLPTHYARPIAASGITLSPAPRPSPPPPSTRGGSSGPSSAPNAAPIP